jgi:hypothetical protein
MTKPKIPVDELDCKETSGREKVLTAEQEMMSHVIECKAPPDKPLHGQGMHRPLYFCMA